MLQEWDPPKHPVEMLELLDVWNHEFVVRLLIWALVQNVKGWMGCGIINSKSVLLLFLWFCALVCVLHGRVGSWLF